MAAVDEEIEQTRNPDAALMGAGPDRGASIERPGAEQLKSLRPACRARRGTPRPAARSCGRALAAEAAARRIASARRVIRMSTSRLICGQQALFANLLLALELADRGIGPA